MFPDRSGSGSRNFQIVSDRSGSGSRNFQKFRIRSGSGSQNYQKSPDRSGSGSPKFQIIPDRIYESSKISGSERIHLKIFRIIADSDFKKLEISGSKRSRISNCYFRAGWISFSKFPKLSRSEPIRFSIFTKPCRSKRITISKKL